MAKWDSLKVNNGIIKENLKINKHTQNLKKAHGEATFYGKNSCSSMYTVYCLLWNQIKISSTLIEISHLKAISSCWAQKNWWFYSKNRLMICVRLSEKCFLYFLKFSCPIIAKNKQWGLQENVPVFALWVSVQCRPAYWDVCGIQSV